MSAPCLPIRAIGIFAATFAAGFAIGPMIGGFLLRSFPWGAVFLINLPVVLLFLLAAPVLLSPILLRPSPSPQDDATRGVGVDLLSLVLSFSGLLLFIYAIKTAAAYGASWTSLFYGVAGLAVLGWFIVRQNAISYPLLDLSLFKDRVFSFAIATGLLSLVVWSAVGWLGSLYLQAVLGFDIFTTALLTLPGAAVITTTCILTSRIVETIGRKAALIATYLFIGSGVGLLLFVTQEQGAILYVASTVAAGVGYGLSFSLVAEVAVSAVPPERAGAASAIAETSNELGNALGISLFGSLAALLFRLLGPGVAATLSETLQQPELPAEILALAKHAHIAGLHAAMGAAAAVMLTVGLSACFWLKAGELAARPPACDAPKAPYAKNHP